jgi:hypothetical protein
MANELTYVWKLTGIVKSTPSNLPIDNVVIGTRWTVTGTDSDGDTGTFTGATPFDLSTVDPDNFTAYADLTEEQVLSWIKNYVLVVNPYWSHITEQIQKQIDKTKQIIEDVSETDLPWSPTSGSVTPTPATPSAPVDGGESEVSGSEE